MMNKQFGVRFLYDKGFVTRNGGCLDATHLSVLRDNNPIYTIYDEIVEEKIHKRRDYDIGA